MECRRRWSSGDGLKTSVAKIGSTVAFIFMVGWVWEYSVLDMHTAWWVIWRCGLMALLGSWLRQYSRTLGKCDCAKGEEDAD